MCNSVLLAIKCVLSVYSTPSADASLHTAACTLYSIQSTVISLFVCLFVCLFLLMLIPGLSKLWPHTDYCIDNEHYRLKENKAIFPQ